MKFNSFILTQLALTSTLMASGAVSVEAKEPVQSGSAQEQPSISSVEAAQYDADIHLDTLDADGHLSILEGEIYTAQSHGQKVAAEPKIAANKIQKSTSEAKYLEAKYSTTEAAKTYGANHVTKSDVQIAAAPKIESNSHGEDHGASKAHGKDHGASKAHGGDHGASKSGDSFLTKHTTEIEFTFAILVIVVGLIASERFQRAQDRQMQMTGESGNQDFGQYEES